MLWKAVAAASERGEDSPDDAESAENVDISDLFPIVMTPEQLRHMSEANNEILEILSEGQKQKIRNGNNLFAVILELSPALRKRIELLAQKVVSPLDSRQKTDLLFLGSAVLDGIDLDRRQSILKHLKANNGEITYNDLVNIGVYQPGDLAEGGFKRFRQNLDMGGPAKFADILEAEYKFNSYGTSFAILELEERARLSTQMATMFAMVAMPLFERMAGGPSKISYDDNVYDNLERQGTKENLKGNAYSAKPPEDVGKVGNEIVATTYNKIKPTQEVVNSQKVEDYAKRLRAGEKLTPVQVANVPGKGVYIINGHHRYVASQKTGIPVEINVVEGQGPVGMSDWTGVQWRKYISESQFWGD